MIQFETLLEILAMIISLLFIRDSKQKAFKWVCLILTITAINEAIIVPWIVSHIPNSINVDYNLFSLLDMFCWFAFFYGIFAQRANRLVILVIAVVNFGSSLTEIIFIRHWIDIISYSHILYDFSVIGMAIFYLYTLLNREYHHLWSDPIFWICAACILYHIVLIPNFASFTESGDFWKNLFAIVNYNILQNVANTVYYLLLSLAFIVNFYNQKQKPDP